jgi:hypothetical protein
VRLSSTVCVGLLVGCHSGASPAKHDGGGSGGPDDAPVVPTEAAADAPLDGPPDAPPCIACGPMTVTVYGDGNVGTIAQPTAGIDVYFVRPDGYAVKVSTGADGVATTSSPAGTTIIVLRKQTSMRWYLEAYEGLLIGDSIVDGPTSYDVPANTFVSTEYFTIPTFNDATLYYLRASCTSGDQRSTSPMIANAVMCSAYTSAAAIVYATDSQGRLGYTSITNVDYTTHQGSGSPIAMPAFQPGGTMSTNFTNLPTTANNYLEVVSFTTLGSDRFTHFGYADLYGGGSGATKTVSGPFVPFGDHTHVVATISRTGFGPIRYTQDIASLALTVPVDASTLPHPVSQAGYDGPSDTIVWTEDATAGVNATSVLGGITWTTFSGISVGFGVHASRTGSSLAMPKLPSDLSQIAYIANQVQFSGVELHTYVGKTYHDELVGQIGSAPLWQAFTP